jgi:hypothetical protein
MRISQAVGLCPSLTILEPDPAFYESIQEAILHELQAWSPVVDWSVFTVHPRIRSPSC